MKMKTQKIYRTKSQITHKCQVEITAREHMVLADEPKPMGDNEGMTPMELLLGALGSCKSLVFKAAAKQHNVQYNQLEIIVEGDFDSAGYLGDPTVAIGFSAIRTIYHVDSDASDLMLENVIAYVESHCPVAATIDVAPTKSAILKRNTLL